jgi:hypothetical protein
MRRMFDPVVSAAEGLGRERDADEVFAGLSRAIGNHAIKKRMGPGAADFVEKMIKRYVEAVRNGGRFTCSDKQWDWLMELYQNTGGGSL